MNLPLGFDPETRIPFTVSDVDRNAGFYIVGVPGAGKSGLLQNLIVHDAEAGHDAPARKKSAIVIDTHGDLVDGVLASLHPDVLIRVSVLDMEDEAWPYGLNLFAEAGTLTTEQERTEAIERIVHIFEVLWPEVMTQQSLPMMLRCTVITFLDNPGTTLPDMIRFFRDDAYRARLLSRVRDRSVHEFFEFEYDQHPDGERRRRIQPLMNRLQQLFVGRSLVRNILGQCHQSINFRRAIERKELVFIKLPTIAMKQDARLIGTILMAQISAAIFSFRNIAPEQRPGVSLFLDEFQTFTTPDFERLFSEARKFGGRLVIAHQQRDQLPSYLDKPTLNAGTVVCFRVEPGDANTLGKLFPSQPGGAFEPSTRATKELLSRTSDFPQGVQAFVEYYLRPIPKGGGDIRVEVAPNLFDYMITGTNGAKVKPHKVNLTNPLSALDALFYEVMQTGNSYLPIPEAAMAGFANVGGGFMGARWVNPEVVLWGLEHFPAHLVHPTPGGYRWVRKPETDKEQLLHCLFHIRQAMVHLATNPVGKEVAGTKDKAAEMLTQLPKRIAFVSSGTQVGVIKTYDLAPAVQGHQRTERFRMLRDQSRARYCHTREEVEQAERPANNQTNDDDNEPPQWQRTEEV